MFVEFFIVLCKHKSIMKTSIIYIFRIYSYVFISQPIVRLNIWWTLCNIQFFKNLKLNLLRSIWLSKYSDLPLIDLKISLIETFSVLLFHECYKQTFLFHLFYCFHCIQNEILIIIMFPMNILFNSSILKIFFS